MPPVSWPTASIFWAWWSCSSAALRAELSWMIPVKSRWPSKTTSLTDRLAGKVLPSLRLAGSSRPIPIIRRLPVLR